MVTLPPCAIVNELPKEMPYMPDDVPLDRVRNFVAVGNGMGFVRAEITGGVKCGGLVRRVGIGDTGES